MSGDLLLVAAQCTNTMHYFTVGSTVSKHVDKIAQGIQGEI